MTGDAGPDGTQRLSKVATSDADGSAMTSARTAHPRVRLPRGTGLGSAIHDFGTTGEDTNQITEPGWSTNGSQGLAGRRIAVVAVGGLREPVVDAPQAALVEHGIVDRERASRVHRVDELDGFREFQPGRVGRDEQRPHRLPGHVQRIAGVAERTVDQMAQVRAAGLSVVDGCVRAAERDTGKPAAVNASPEETPTKSTPVMAAPAGA
uniref:hypothetical protein n=1 Tax=Saccharopolyspora gregorii TaxID=33914 RepID=UPI0021ACA574|nr:hypothetical protein [Saccharopolyspora gregorii]